MKYRHVHVATNVSHCFHVSTFETRESRCFEERHVMDSCKSKRLKVIACLINTTPIDGVTVIHDTRQLRIFILGDDHHYLYMPLASQSGRYVMRESHCFEERHVMGSCKNKCFKVIAYLINTTPIDGVTVIHDTRQFRIFILGDDHHYLYMPLASQSGRYVMRESHCFEERHVMGSCKNKCFKVIAYLINTTPIDGVTVIHDTRQFRIFILEDDHHYLYIALSSQSICHDLNQYQFFSNKTKVDKAKTCLQNTEYAPWNNHSAQWRNEEIIWVIPTGIKPQQNVT